MKPHLLILALSTVLVGCVARPQPAGILIRPLWDTRSSRLFVVSGRFLTNWTELETGVARYELTNLDRKFNRVVVDLTFHKLTSPPQFPSPALLVLKRSGRYTFEVFGEDATEGIIADNRHNREALAHKIATGSIYPSKRRWLDRKAAKATCQRALSLSDGEVNTSLFRFQRYELGWEISVIPGDSEGVVGAECTIVVGDDGMVKGIYHGF